MPRPDALPRLRYYPAALLDRATGLKPIARAREAVAAARVREDPRSHRGLPVPPARLRVLVSGPDRDHFLDEVASGVASIRETLGHELRGSVLDFGCGCGRTARHWQGLDLDLHGCDYNPELVQWCRENLPFMTASVNGAQPPLPHPDGRFDVVYAMSILTHMTEETQLRWLDEWKRTLRPGGLLLFTTHGDSHREKLGKKERPRYDAGGLVVRHPRIEGLNKCVALHPPSYVRERLLAGWELEAFRPASDYAQDVWLARRPRI